MSGIDKRTSRAGRLRRTGVVGLPNFKQKALEGLTVLLQARAMLVDEPRSAPPRDRDRASVVAASSACPNLGSPVLRKGGGGLGDEGAAARLDPLAGGRREVDGRVASGG